MAISRDDSLRKFCSLWERAPVIERQEPLRLGQANDGIVVYHLKQWESPDRDEESQCDWIPMRVVRKRTRQEAEFQFAQVLERKFWEGRQPRTLPDVYMTWRGNAGMELFVEYVPGIVRRPLRTRRKEALDLASALAEVRTLEFPGCEEVDVKRVLRARGRRIKSWNSEGFAKPLDLEGIHDIGRFAATKVKTDRSVFCHNDVGWPNCSLTPRRGARARIIDFALMGYNTEGAELHHFLAYALRCDKLRFFDHLITACAEKWRVDADVLRWGCIEFTVYRGLQRIHRMWKGGDREKAAREAMWLRDLPRVIDESSLPEPGRGFDE